MKEYLQINVSNDQGERASLRWTDYNQALSGQEIKAQVDQLLAAQVLTGKKAVFTTAQEAKVVRVQEDILFD